MAGGTNYGTRDPSSTGAAAPTAIDGTTYSPPLDADATVEHVFNTGCSRFLGFGFCYVDEGGACLPAVALATRTLVVSYVVRGTAPEDPDVILEHEVVAHTSASILSDGPVVVDVPSGVYDVTVRSAKVLALQPHAEIRLYSVVWEKPA